MSISKHRRMKECIAYYQVAVDLGMASGFQEVRVEDILLDVKTRFARSRNSHFLGDKEADKDT
jgi:hypothetical protein